MLGRACAQLMGPDPAAPIGTTVQYMLLMCCMMKSMTHTTLGELDIAEQFQARAEAIAEQSSRPFDRIAAAYSGGNLMLARGNPAGAAIVFDEAFTLAQEHGVGLFLPITACYRGLAYLEQGDIGAAREILAGAREAAKSIGYKSIELRAAIYLALALSHRIADVPAALDLLREARNTARQQGFSGLEAEALLGEAMVTPATNEEGRATITRSLQACIALATRSEASPLLQKAEALLGMTLAGGA
jgi:tetratricopeptide (TPR) repeat protein